MKLLELAPRPDEKGVYRSIAAAAKSGSQQDPPLSAPVQLFDDAVTPQPDKAGLAKLAGQLRSGLGSLKDGRYTVLHVGNIAYVSVNTKPVVARKKKETSAKPPAAPPKPKK